MVEQHKRMQGYDPLEYLRFEGPIIKVPTDAPIVPQEVQETSEGSGEAKEELPAPRLPPPSTIPPIITLMDAFLPQYTYQLSHPLFAATIPIPNRQISFLNKLLYPVTHLYNSSMEQCHCITKIDNSSICAGYLDGCIYYLNWKNRVVISYRRLTIMLKCICLLPNYKIAVGGANGYGIHALPNLQTLLCTYPPRLLETRLLNSSSINSVSYFPVGNICMTMAEHLDIIDFTGKNIRSVREVGKIWKSFDPWIMTKRLNRCETLVSTSNIHMPFFMISLFHEEGLRRRNALMELCDNVNNMILRLDVWPATREMMTGTNDGIIRRYRIKEIDKSKSVLDCDEIMPRLRLKTKATINSVLCIKKPFVAIGTGGSELSIRIIDIDRLDVKLLRTFESLVTSKSAIYDICYLGNPLN